MRARRGFNQASRQAGPTPSTPDRSASLPLRRPPVSQAAGAPQEQPMGACAPQWQAGHPFSPLSPTPFRSSTSRQELYGGRLSAHRSVAGHTLAGVAGVGGVTVEQPVLLLIDTAGCDMDEQKEEEGDSTVRGVRAGF